MSDLIRPHRRTIALLWLLASVGLTARAASQGPLADLDTYVERVLRDWNAPGIAVAVVKDDRVVYAKGFGVRRAGTNDPVDAETVFAIASTSKAFTAAALGMLVDQGLLSWDDRVTDHLEQFRLWDPYATHELTIRDLLSHRSGLPRGDRLWYLSPFDRDEVVRRVRGLEPAWGFRERYGYQNIMFTTAGEVVEAVTDTSWDAFISHRIFEPLNMRCSSTSIRDLHGHSNVATPHGRFDGEPGPIIWPNFDNLGGAGSINSCVRDLAEWMRLQLGEGVYATDTLLSDSVVQEMHTPQMIVRRGREETEMFPESHFAAYGLGWRLGDYRGRLVVRHGGALDGMRTHVLLVPEEELGVAAITNVNESRIPQAIVWHVVDRYLGPREKDWNAAYLAAAQRAGEEAAQAREARERQRQSGTKPTHPLADLAGSYSHPLYGTAVVVQAGETLVIEVGPHFVGDLEHWHLDTFRATWRNRYLGRAFVGFQLDRTGRVVSVDVEGFGRFERETP
ncbi:MAG: serine hydrolase [Gemmatimonadales bacterium]|jgi:CubicO group peptidase (beta-lactamase class C family)